MRQHTKRRLIKLFVTAAFFYVFFRAKYYSAHFDTLVAENPHQVWEFVSDLSNAKRLNPSIYDFDILHDNGNYGHWEYGAVIYETMSFIPLLTNTNYANFVLKPSPKNDHFKILSNYTTCFFRYACLNSHSEMIFSTHKEGGTQFHESIDYQCPFVLSWLCTRELQHQRKEWMHRLKLVYQQ